MNLYDWPEFSEATELDRTFKKWSGLVRDEIQPVIDTMYMSLPDDAVELDRFVTERVEGWAPRIAALHVTSEWFLQEAKSEKWPQKLRDAAGKPLNTDADRTSEYEGLLKDYRFVRNYLEMLVTMMRDRMRWAQSVRKQHADVNSGVSF